MSRSKAQREQDRADLLAVLEDATKLMTTRHVAQAVHGDVTDAWRHEAQVLRDLNALARGGEVEKQFFGFHINGLLWQRATSTTLSQRDEQDDVRDLTRQMAGWEPADEEATS